MKKIYQKLSKSFVVNLFSSLELAVVCLGLLAILTFWGTLYQADYGLYAAQHKFFGSWFFTTMGFIPFPGARLVLWVFFMNSLVSIIFRQKHNWSNFGILLIHYGILLLLVGAFAIFHYAKESHVTLEEGQGTNVSADYMRWELAVWAEPSSPRKVKAVDVSETLLSQDITFSDFAITAHVEKYYPNCDAFSGKSASRDAPFINSSGIKSVKPKTAESDPVKNIPGVILNVKEDVSASQILLYGNDPAPTSVSAGDKKYYFHLRHIRTPLPLTIALKDFRMDKHPGTEMARSYESTVEIDTGRMKRDIVISMNRPLRYEEYTFYQASYMIGEDGREYSTLAVVKNKGRIIPYLATLVTGLGLANHFLIRLIIYLRKRNPKGKRT